MIGIEHDLAALEQSQMRLREVLEPILGDYEYIFLDCPPALDLLTVNALVAAHGVLVQFNANFMRWRAWRTSWVRLKTSARL